MAFHDDNLDIDEPSTTGARSSMRPRFPVGALDAIGLAANAYGVTTVVNLDPATGAGTRRVLNDLSAALAAGRGA